MIVAERLKAATNVPTGGAAGIQFIGHATASDDAGGNINSLVFDISGISIQNGDLIFILTNGDSGDPLTVSGATTVLLATSGSNTYIGYDTLNGSETSITATGTGISDATGIVAVFRNCAVENTVTASNGGGMPDPPPVGSSVFSEGWVIAFGGLDDDPITATAQSGYTLIASVSVGSSGAATTSMMSYTNQASFGDNPGAFGGSGNDAWWAASISLIEV